MLQTFPVTMFWLFLRCHLIWMIFTNLNFKNTQKSHTFKVEILISFKYFHFLYLRNVGYKHILNILPSLKFN